jgi:PAS domain S-box-containing protein
MRAISTEWRMTFDAISEAICLLDLEENVSRCNRSARNLFGRLFSEIIGRKLGELLPANPEPIARCIVRMRHSRGREVCRLQTSDRWLRAAMDPVLDDTGVLVGAVLILSEITDNSHQSTAQTGPL